MKRIIAGAAIAAALFVAPASAQNMTAPSAGAPPPPARALTIPATPGKAIGVGQVGPQPTYVVPPTVSVGTLAGEVLAWVVAAFGSVLATVFTAWGVRLFKLAGVQIGDAARARLQEIMQTDERFDAAKHPPPFDGKRMIFGGFAPVLTLGE